jgi:hypothetical protein
MKSEAVKKPKCDCHLHDHQVCDICQRVGKRPAKDRKLREKGGSR